MRHDASFVPGTITVSAVAKALGLGWDLVNDLAVSETRAMVYDQPGHFDGVRVLGVDEHKWKHVRGDGSSSFTRRLGGPDPGRGRHRPVSPVGHGPGAFGEGAHRVARRP